MMRTCSPCGQGSEPVIAIPAQMMGLNNKIVVGIVSETPQRPSTFSAVFLY